MNEIGFEPGYAYDDLVFSNDAVFIVQFDSESENKMKLFINEDCEKDVSNSIRTGFINLAEKEGIEVIYNGTYHLNAKDEKEQIEIVFNA